MSQKIVGNDAPVAAPPEHLRTHDRNSRLLSRLDKPDETPVKIVSKRIIRIIMKTLDPPECVGLRWHRLRPWSSSTKLWKMAIPDPLYRQLRLETGAIIVPITPGIGKSPHIRDQCHAIMAQKCNKIR
ncbi:hypothetical protein A0U92_03125 [Acetobacter aceti]|uniref:Uncharacterized protein n=1 Tax=Acetobacter aceti TaxID=435 RepID=A0A1U9KDX0_ACEAC|nr:hypothetical protein A0U92_03125 [Acetobacter aceti]